MPLPWTMHLPMMQLEKKPVKVLGTFGMPPERFGYAVRKQDKELLKTLNTGLKMLMKDPYWQELIKKIQTRPIRNKDQGHNNGMPPALHKRKMLHSIEVIISSLPYVLGGAAVTVGIVVGAMTIGFFIGLPLSLAQVYGNKPLKFLADTYVWFF